MQNQFSGNLRLPIRSNSFAGICKFSHISHVGIVKNGERYIMCDLLLNILYTLRNLQKALITMKRLRYRKKNELIYT